VRDVTYVFYDCEEIEAERNGLGRLARTRPDLLVGDFAILMEPSNAVVEAGHRAYRRLDQVRDHRLVAAHRLDVDEGSGERDDIGGQVEWLRHAGHCALPADLRLYALWQVPGTVRTGAKPLE
ncbi:MAG TPA: hypothetical protein VFR22_02100, partial [Nocardioidaceae bacterium]|nr:hypothetical protein [Nocardioidaceae bacterium]